MMFFSDVQIRSNQLQNIHKGLGRTLAIKHHQHPLRYTATSNTINILLDTQQHQTSSTILLDTQQDTLRYTTTSNIINILLDAQHHTLIHHLNLSIVSAADLHFDGFDADDETLDDDTLHLIDFPLRSPTPPTITQSDTIESDHGVDCYRSLSGSDIEQFVISVVAVVRSTHLDADGHGGDFWWRRKHRGYAAVTVAEEEATT
ncbi:hypothetical protein LOK49_LG06G01639 [Camellia lanceoleosa]|uniref:Uncharacterized protein n=1 Tax=Camellia lanceoleosa TaxID=1840588 RepID=A0ACC0HA44_9ERIC|nr:hypothetical protein LOK49_LG06G01639 [Camellia lanceoleosa]